jgi:hypothetical protein
MTEESRARTDWVERRREQRRRKQELRGDSPEKAAERHTPKGGVIDTMLKLGGIQRESRFKRD